MSEQTTNKPEISVWYFGVYDDRLGLPFKIPESETPYRHKGLIEFHGPFKSPKLAKAKLDELRETLDLKA